nr:manganese superoxide dismutase [Pinctada fucata]
MQLHHKKHHQTYVNNLNIAEEKLAEAVATNDVNTTIKLQSAIRFNGGGHLNHSIFWETLSPHASEDIPKGDLREMICRDFGSVEDMKKEMSAASVAIQGSGWGWLAFNPVNKHLKIVTCANQDPLEATTGNIPLFGIDVWEHAYYLQYKNVRPDYVNAIWHIVNWENVSKRLHDAQMKT